MLIKILSLSTLFIILPFHAFDDRDELTSSLSCLGYHYKKYNNQALAKKYMTLALEDGGDIDTLMIYGYECTKNGQITQAREYFNKVSGKNPVLGSLILMILEDNMQGAFEYACYLQTKLMNNLCLNAATMIGNICLKMGKYRLAEKYYQEAITYGIGRNLYTDLARCYEKQGNFTQAIPHYISAVQHDKYSNALYHLGKIYYQQGNLDLALMVLEDYEQDDNSRLLLAQIHYDLSNLDQCERYAQEASLKLPNPLNSYTLKAAIKEHKRITQETLFLQEVAIEYMNMKQYEEALEHLLRIVDLDTANNAIFQHLSTVYKKLGRANEFVDLMKRQNR